MRSGVARELYDDAAAVGRASALGQAALVTLLGVGGVALGVYLVGRGRSEQQADGLATRASTCGAVAVPAARGAPPRTRRECWTPVAYDAAGARHELALNTGERSLGAGEGLRVYYQPGRPGEASASPTPATLGYAIAAVAAVAVIGAWASVYLTRRSRVYAAATGAGTVRRALLD
jgi:hypothetical protein